MQRRTRREFSQKELSFEALSKLLFYTWGVTGFLEIPVLGRLPLKTSPSAGARHPVEAYLLGMRIEGLEPGLYHYGARAHCLERLRMMRNVPDKAGQFCVGQRWAREAAALFIMTAVFRVQCGSIRLLGPTAPFCWMQATYAKHSAWWLRGLDWQLSVPWL